MHNFLCMRMFHYVTFLFLITLFCSPKFAQGVTLGISADGRFFTIDGVPTYLNGVSYYGAQSISTAGFRTDDLDDMVADGFNWIRVWMFWDSYTSGNVSVTDQNGNVREPYMARLKTLITECNNRGMIVDCSMSHGSAPAPSTFAQHRACAQTLANQLLPYRNVYIDISNERDVGDARYVSLPDCGLLIDAVKAIDPDRLCTASGVPDSQTDLSNYFTQGHVDFITPHLCRSAGCSAQTVGTVNQFVDWMTNLGFRAPVHLQEPFRRGYTTYNPTAEDFFRDCSGGKVAEAAGWCLHNGDNKFSGDYRPYRCFSMINTEGRLYAQWDSVEQEVTANIAEHLGGTSWDARRYQAEYSEQLSHQTGQKEGYGWSANTASHSAGYLSYGPYVDTLDTGQYEVTWRMMIDNNSGDNNTVVTLDVRDADTGGTLASRTVNRQEFTATYTYQNFTVTFDYTSAGHRLEFRTYWHDNAYIKLDHINAQLAPPDIAPIIAEVSPDPDTAYLGNEYIEQLTLIQGTPPPTWSVVQGPSGTQVSGDGTVSGWTPHGSDIFGAFTFIIQASNSEGSDAESWQVTVSCRADFDDDKDVDLEDFGLIQACYSGSGIPFQLGCEDADLHPQSSPDGDVDQDDFDVFISCMGGANKAPAC